MARVEERAARRQKLPVWLRITAGLIVALLIVAAIGTAASVAWLKKAMREQLPTLDGELHLPGLTAPVVVRRDAAEYPISRPQTWKT